MSDCVNVEVRELLPELASGRLDAETRARVEAHLVGCPDCAAELDTLRRVRAAFAKAPAIDARRIARALPPPPSARPARRWADWRVAAAIAAMTVGGLSVAVTQRVSPPRAETPKTGTPDVVAESVLASSGSAPNVTDTAPGRARVAGGASADAALMISFGGGVSDLEAADMRELLGALEEIDSAPVAPAVEPDRGTVLPALREDGV